MKTYFATEQEGAFQAGATPAGRAAAALERFSFLFPLVMVGGAIFFLPDYIGRYHQQEPVPGFFLAVLAAVAFFVAGLASVLRFLRTELWVLDPADDMLVYETNRLLGGVQQAGIELGAVHRFRLEEGSFPKSTGLFVELDGGKISERIFETKLGAADLIDVAHQLEEFVAASDLDIPFETVEK